MPKFFYGNDETGKPYGGLLNSEDVPPIESSVAAWILTMRARYDEWPAHFAVREHLESKEQKALYRLISRGWVAIEDVNGIVRYSIPEAEHTNARRRRMAGASWGKVIAALEPDPPRFLSKSARKLLISLIEDRDEKGCVEKSLSRLSLDALMPVATANRALIELEEWGMITRERPQGRRWCISLIEARLKEYAGVKV